MTDAKKKTYEGFTAEERAAMKEYADELKTTARRGSRATKEDGEKDVLAKIAQMADADRLLAERVHAIVKEAVPELAPRTWYGMPAYAKDGAVICFFKPGAKFKMRYSELGFSDKANLDDGEMWPSAYALVKLTGAEEKKIAALVKHAAS
ncbi:MAG TPA: hypothetical protein VN133_04000 [Humibacter sp.]|nr:hypothetical protein [Humibacter sp.]